MQRVTSLDGLRGVAAVVVLISHIVLTDPIAADVVEGTGRAPVGSWEWFAAYTPVHLLWGGAEAVFVFFILSGFVLTPSTSSRTRWLEYYPKRLVRLYLPVWASLVLAVGATFLIPDGPIAGASHWINAHTGQDPADAVTGALLVNRTPGWINNPLWSISLEIVFSLALPVYVLLCRWSTRGPGRTVVAVVVLSGALVAGLITDVTTLQFLPMFAFGMLLATHQARLARSAATLGSVGWLLLGVVAVVCLTGSWMLGGLPDTAAPVRIVAHAAQVLGAVLVVFIAAHGPSARRFLECRPVQWAGAVSFSLYLTHDPVLAVTTFALGGHPPLWLVLMIVVPTVLVVAQLFFLAVEGPSHLAARAVGRLALRLDSRQCVKA